MDMDGDDACAPNAANGPAAAQSSANGGCALPASPPQVRSRITVVCAECKRLKLKCDRRTPCASCVKRDTVVRCIYSPAAAEKVDLHSLNNRLIHVEALLAQFQTEGAPPPNPHSTSTAPPQQQAQPQPLTAPLSVPLGALHAAFLADLGLPLPALPVPVRIKTEALPLPFDTPHAHTPLAASPALLGLLPPPARLPSRLAAAHAALAALAAAPFPFRWFDARAYAFLSALAAAPSSSPTTTTTTSAPGREEKDARRRQRERNRERARAIFAGGAQHLHAQHEQDSDEEIDELDDRRDVRLHAPQQTPRARRGDPRLAFFALLCAVLALDGAPEEAALASRAAEEYFASSGSGEGGDAEAEAQGDVDAVLALWVLGVRMLREGGSDGLEGVYVHLAKTVAHARVVGLDSPSSSPLSSSSSSSSSFNNNSAANNNSINAAFNNNNNNNNNPFSPSYASTSSYTLGTNGHAQAQAQAQGGQRRKRAVVKTEDGAGAGVEEVPMARESTGTGREGREAEVLRRRAWWAVVWGDVLVSDALGLVPASLSSSSSSGHVQQQGKEDEPLLDAAYDWEEGGDAAGESGSGAGAGKRFGAGVRLAKLLAGGTDEGAVRVWEQGELARLEPRLLHTTGEMGGGEEMDLGDGSGERERERGIERGGEKERERAEIRLLAGRAVLRAWVGVNGSSTSQAQSQGQGQGQGQSTSPQAVFGAVGAAHGIVQACRALAACAPPQVHGQAQASPHSAHPGHAQSAPSLALLASPPARALFDAGVVCAHAALRHPGAVFAPGARMALEGAVGLFRGGWGASVHAGPDHAAAQGWAGRGEALRVLEALLARARGAPAPTSAPAPAADALASPTVRIADGSAHAGPTVVKINELKRKHDAVGRGAEAELREREMAMLGKDGAGMGMGMGKDGKEKKKRAYPAVGIRVRPGKEAALGLGAPVRKGSKDAAYFAQQQQQVPSPVQQPPQRQEQQQPSPVVHHQQQQQMAAFRSRSSSLSQHAELAMEYAYPPQQQQQHQGYADAPPPLQQAYADAPQQPQGYADPPQQQQGYAGDTASTALYDLQPPRAGAFDMQAQAPRAGSFDAGSPYTNGNAAGSAASPYGNGNSAASPFSAASSPYTTTSTGASASAGTSVNGGLSTPTFGGPAPSVNGSPPAFAGQNGSPPAAFGGQNANASVNVNANPSPPTFGGPAQGQTASPPYAFYGAYEGGYDAHGHGHGGHGMALDAAAGYESKGAPMFEVKPPMMEQQQHHHHAHHPGAYHHLEPEPPRHPHEIVWPPPEPPQHQYWASDDYKFYPQ